jgi:hypothetical protein
MNHRERVWMTLNHEKPDRCPLQAGFTPEFATGRPRWPVYHIRAHKPFLTKFIYQ